jgi:hypothetical protein
MKTQANKQLSEQKHEVWFNRLTWAIPIFFLIKGLLWLAVPLVLGIYHIK